MKRFTPGDKVRIDIPDETDPDHERYHGRKGVVSDVIDDDAGVERGDERDSYIFQIELDSGEIIDVRWRDLRPA